jgi:hypothetical protein
VPDINPTKASTYSDPAQTDISPSHTGCHTVTTTFYMTIQTYTDLITIPPGSTISPSMTATSTIGTFKRDVSQEDETDEQEAALEESYGGGSVREI